MTLVIPDIHERIDRLAAILQPCLERADKIIYLGDWFDTFEPYSERRLWYTCKFINGTASGTEKLDGTIIETIKLLGNHDCSYFFDNAAMLCSGFEWRKKAIITDTIRPNVVRQFKLFHREHGYLLSHAGFCEQTIQHANEEECQHAIDTALSGGFDPLFGAGRARGGYQMVGGPTWLDWDREFEHIDDCPQLVGHTEGTDVRMRHERKCPSHHTTDPTNDNEEPCVCKPSVCIDTSLHHVAWLDEGGITIERIAYDRS